VLLVILQSRLRPFLSQLLLNNSRAVSNGGIKFSTAQIASALCAKNATNHGVAVPGRAD
jgi:hypothetical protein